MISCEIIFRNPEKLTEGFVFKFGNNRLWIENLEGEGVELKEQKLYNVVKKLFEENF